MYLSTIKDKDIGFNKYGTMRQSRSLFTGDIVGKRRHIENSHNFNLRNNDIERSQPKKLNQPLNKAYYHLRNDDIEGSRPCMNKFKTKRAPSNPLNPSYILPSYDELEPVCPKFIRDTLNIDDIKGTKPRTFIKTKQPRRDINDITDIDGTRPRKEYLRKQMLNPLSVKDINEFRIFKTSRITNPLDPEYVVPGEEDNTKVTIGKIEGSQSKRLHPVEVNRTVSFSLKNDDIGGSQIGTTGNPHIKTKNRRNFTAINKTDDIPGAQRSTLKKGMKTKRCLNPLTPDYSYPGHIQDQEYIKSLYDPHYKKESASIGIVGALGNRDANAIVESKIIKEEAQQDSGIPMPDYQFESMADQKAEQPAPQVQEITPVVDQQAPQEPQQPKLVPQSSSKSSKSKSSKSKKSIQKKKKDFVVKRRKSKKPLHKRINKEQYENDKFNFYGVDKNQSRFSNVQNQINIHFKKLKGVEKKQLELSQAVQPKLTKLQRFDKFMQEGF